MLGERRLRRVRRGFEAPGDVVADSLGAGRGHDRVEEGRQLLGRLEVDLGPQAHRIGHPLVRLGQVRRRLLEPRDHALDPIREWRKVAGEQREQRLADVLGRLRGTGPWPVLGQPVEAEPSLVDGEIAIEPALRAQLARVDGRELVDRAAVERDLLVDGVAAAGREIAVVVVQAEEGGALGADGQLVAKPAVDRAIEAGVDVGRGQSHVLLPRGGRAGRSSRRRDRVGVWAGRRQPAGASTRSRKPSIQPG